jgi:hypothetical protein
VRGGVAVAAIVVLVSAACVLLLRGHLVVEDETFHYKAIRAILRHGRVANLPMFPAYHMFLAEIGRALHVRSLDESGPCARLALLSVWVFHLCAGKIDRSTAANRTLQFFFLLSLSSASWCTPNRCPSFSCCRPCWPTCTGDSAGPDRRDRRRHRAAGQRGLAAS